MQYFESHSAVRKNTIFFFGSVPTIAIMADPYTASLTTRSIPALCRMNGDYFQGPALWFFSQSMSQ